MNSKMVKKGIPDEYKIYTGGGKGKMLAAPLGRRILAFLIDWLIVFLIILWPFGDVLRRLIPAANFSDAYQMISSQPENTGSLGMILFVMSLFALLYFMILEWKLGQTIGKIFLRIKAVNEEGRNPGFFQSFVRNMYAIPFFPFFIFWFVDPIFMFFTQKRQRLSEKLSATYTVEER